MTIPTLRERMSFEYQKKLKNGKLIVAVCDFLHIGKKSGIYKEAKNTIERDELIDIGLKPDEVIHKGVYGHELRIKRSLYPTLYYVLPEEDVLEIQKDFDRILGEEVTRILRETEWRV